MKHPDSLSLESVTGEPQTFGCELTIPVSALDRGPLNALSALRLEGEVSRIEGGYALAARLVYEGELECSRCLASYPFREDEQFSLLLYPRERQPAPDVELGPGDLDVLYYDDPVVALSPIVEERVQMALPMKPLCSVECRGLCVVCGKDLNQGPCACPRAAPDPRWEALKALREKV